MTWAPKKTTAAYPRRDREYSFRFRAMKKVRHSNYGLSKSRSKCCGLNSCLPRCCDSNSSHSRYCGSSSCHSRYCDSNKSRGPLAEPQFGTLRTKCSLLQEVEVCASRLLVRDLTRRGLGPLRDRMRESQASLFYPSFSSVTVLGPLRFINIDSGVVLTAKAFLDIF